MAVLSRGVEVGFGMKEGERNQLVDVKKGATSVHVVLFVLGEDIWMDEVDNTLSQLQAGMYSMSSVSQSHLTFHFVVSSKNELRYGRRLQKLTPNADLQVHELASALKNASNYNSEADMKRVLAFFGSKKIGEPPDDGESGRDMGNRMMVQKIFAPIVIPNSVADVILVDTDMLWLQDITRIWEVREDFAQDQLVGMACEPDSCGKVPKGEQQHSLWSLWST
jgi:hypothetical protein